GQTTLVKNPYLIFRLHKGMTENECLDAIRISYQNIASQTSKPTIRAKKLLKLCETAQKSCENTDTLISFLLDIYYEIYIIFNNPKKVLSDYHEIMVEFFVCVKKLLIMENTNSKYHEIINILLCTPFACGMTLPSYINNFLKYEYSNI